MASSPGGPAAAAWRNAANAANNAQPRQAVMLCSAQRRPAIAVSWRQHDFGRLRRGAATPIQDLVISSTGGVDLANITVAVQGNQFAVVNPGGFATSLPPGGTTTVRIRFSPSLYGPQNSTVTITSNAANEDPVILGIQGSQYAMITFVVEQETGGAKLENVKLKVKQVGKADEEKLTDAAGKVEVETEDTADFEIMLGDYAEVLEFRSLTSA